MTTPATGDVTGHVTDDRSCEHMIVCDHGCDPAPCGARPVTTRASFTCINCTVRHVLLLCADCAAAYAQSTHPYDLRPL
jgi:hypothetical protein